MRKRVREIEFDVDDYTARLIGRENVSKLEGAVLEIVKNAYLVILPKRIPMLQKMEGYRQEQKELVGLLWIVCLINVICLRFQKKEVWSGL